MENIIENKAKFFAQYWGQCVQIRSMVEQEYHHLFIVSPEDCYGRLELKPLSQITDEECVIISEIFTGIVGSEKNEMTIANVKEMLFGEDEMPNLFSSIVDKLREWSYAYEYNQTSVEQQIQWGWIKLKTI